MWKPPMTFVTLHYAYIILLGVLGLIVLYPYGNLSAIDAYFFGVSASTESGLNTIDTKELSTYQQLLLYFIPMVSNLGFVNIVVVVVRLYWFEKHMKQLGLHHAHARPPGGNGEDVESAATHSAARIKVVSSIPLDAPKVASGAVESMPWDGKRISGDVDMDNLSAAPPEKSTTRIAFAPDADRPTTSGGGTLYVPPPQARDRGQPVIELDETQCDDDDAALKPEPDAGPSSQGCRRRRGSAETSRTLPIERAASSVFVLGAPPRLNSGTKSIAKSPELPGLSSQATIGRNSSFANLTVADRERLGGIEYRSLKLLLKIVLAYFFGLHVLGAIALSGWIQTADPVYRDYLTECGQDKTWWGIYSAQTMVDNLGFTLTPDSMISFRDATFPMILMSFLAYAGHTCYPIILRLVIWTMSKVFPRKSSFQEPLSFLLDHPRRCYTLLFPSRPTWILFGIFFVLNFVDIILIITLDLHNPAVSDLPGGRRVLAAIFQAASSRHTGTASFNLADVHPAVQFSLLVMMYISVYPIAISVRASNTYEEKSLGIYARDEEPDMDDQPSRTYVLMHLRNQLSFDLWYVFLGIFCITIAEADKIVDDQDPAFAFGPIFFEVVSAYANVGLSLGYPTVFTSLSGQFTTFSKLVVCAMMIRGRHRGLPYQLDRAILLPDERLTGDIATEPLCGERWRGSDLPRVKKYHTR